MLSVPDEHGCRYAYTVYFDKVREGVYYGFIRRNKKEHIHFNLIYVQDLIDARAVCVRHLELPCIHARVSVYQKKTGCWLKI